MNANIIKAILYSYLKLSSLFIFECYIKIVCDGDCAIITDNNFIYNFCLFY